MAADFILVAELQYQSNTASLRNIYSQLNQAGRGLDVQVNPRISPQALAGIDRLSSGLRGVRVGLGQADVAARGTTASMRAMAQVTVDASGFLENLGTQAGLAAKRFVAFTVAAGTMTRFAHALRETVAEAVDFELQMNKIAQISSEAGREVQGVQRNITSLATSLGVPSRELAQVAEQLKQTGLSIREVNEALPALARASLAPSFGSMTKTAQGATAAMRQFGIATSEFEATLSSMNAVAAGFAVESEDIIEAIKRAGGTFRTAGGDLNEFLGIFTSIRATTRESAETISTGLRTIFGRIQRADVVQQLHDYGVQLRYTRQEAERLGNTGLENQFVGAYEAVSRLSSALKGLPATDPRYAQIVEQLGGLRQISRVIPLIQQYGEAQKAVGVAQAGRASLEIAAEKRQETLAASLVKTKEEWLKLGRAFVSSDGFKALAHTALDFANSLAKIVDFLRPLVPMLTTLAAVKIFTGLGTSLGNFGRVFTSTTGAQVVPRRSGFARGGVVPGVGDTDSVPAHLPVGSFVLRKKAAQALAPVMLTPGEHVFSPEEVSRIGLGRLHQANARGYAGGGLVGKARKSAPSMFAALGMLLHGGPSDKDVAELMERERKQHITQLIKSAQQSPRPRYAAGGLVQHLAGGGSTQPLTPEQQRLVEENLDLARQVARRRKYRSFAQSLPGGLEEAESVGHLELVRRAQKYNPANQGKSGEPISFAQYASQAIGKRIIREAQKRQREMPLGGEAGELLTSSVASRTSTYTNRQMAAAHQALLAGGLGDLGPVPKSKKAQEKLRAREDRIVQEVAARFQGVPASQVEARLTGEPIGPRGQVSLAYHDPVAAFANRDFPGVVLGQALQANTAAKAAGRIAQLGPSYPLAGSVVKPLVDARGRYVGGKASGVYGVGLPPTTPLLPPELAPPAEPVPGTLDPRRLLGYTPPDAAAERARLTEAARREGQAHYQDAQRKINFPEPPLPVSGTLNPARLLTDQSQQVNVADARREGQRQQQEAQRRLRVQQLREQQLAAATKVSGLDRRGRDAATRQAERSAQQTQGYRGVTDPLQIFQLLRKELGSIQPQGGAEHFKADRLLSTAYTVLPQNISGWAQATRLHREAQKMGFDIAGGRYPAPPQTGAIPPFNTVPTTRQEFREIRRQQALRELRPEQLRAASKIAADYERPDRHGETGDQRIERRNERDRAEVTKPDPLQLKESLLRGIRTGQVTPADIAAASKTLSAPQLSQVNHAFLTATGTRRGNTTVDLPQAIAANAGRRADEQVAGRGFVSQATRTSLGQSALEREQANVVRELVSAQRNLLQRLHPMASSTELNRAANEDVAKALAGEAKVVRSTTGRLLGLESTVQQATAQKVSAPGAGGVRFGVGNFFGRVGNFLGTEGPAARFANNLAGRLPSGLGTAALFGLPGLAGISDHLAGRAEDRVAQGTEGVFKGFRGVSGGFQGALVGATAGAALGSFVPVIGTAIGGAVGAAVGGITNFVASLRDAAREIREVRIANAMTTFGERLNQLVVGLGNPQLSPEVATSALSSLRTIRGETSEKNAREATGLLGFGQVNPSAFIGLQARSLRQDFGNSLPQIQQSLSGQAQRLGRDNPNAGVAQLEQALRNGSGGLNREFLHIIAGIRGLSIDEVMKDFVKEIQNAQNAARSERRNLQGRRAEESSAHAFGRLVLSVQAAADSITRLREKSRVLTDAFEGVGQATTISLHPERVQALGRNDNAFRGPLGLVRDFGGETGQALSRSGEAVNEIAAVLPDVLARQRAGFVGNPEEHNAGPDFVTSTRRALVAALGFSSEASLPPEHAEALSVVGRGLDQLQGGERGLRGLLDESSIDPSKLAERILDPMAGPLKEATEKFVRQLQDETNHFITGIHRLSQAASQVGELRDRQASVRAGGFRTSLEFQAQRNYQSGRVLQDVPLAQLETAFQSRQQRLTGLQGDKANDPAAIGRSLGELRRQIVTAEENQQRVAETSRGPGRATALEAAARNLQSLRDRANNAQQALRHLADVSERTAAAQEKLAQINADRNDRRSFIERFLSSDLNEQANTQRSGVLAEHALAQGHVNNFVPEDVARIFQYLRSAGNVTLATPRGPLTGHNAAEFLTDNSHPDARLPAHLQQQQDELQGTITGRYATAEKALAQLSKDISNAQKGFFDNLSHQHQEFFNRLAQELVRDQIGRAQAQLGPASEEVSRRNDQTRQAELLRSVGITSTSQAELLQGHRGDLESFAGATTTVNRLRRIAETGGPTVANKLFASGRGFDYHRRLDEDQRKALDESLGDEGISEQARRNIAIRIEQSLRNTPTHVFNDNFRLPVDRSRQIVEQSVRDELTSGRDVTEARSVQRRAGRGLEGIAGLDLGRLGEVLTGPQGGEFRRSLGTFNSSNRLEDLPNNLAAANAGFLTLTRRITDLNRGLGELSRENAERIGRRVAGSLATGLPLAFASGGVVGVHPGSPQGTDTIPAWLSPREFVVNARSAQANPSLLNHINRARGPVHLAEGGPSDDHLIDIGLQLINPRGGIPRDAAIHFGRAAFDSLPRDLQRARIREYEAREHSRRAVAALRERREQEEATRTTSGPSQATRDHLGGLQTAFDNLAPLRQATRRRPSPAPIAAAAPALSQEEAQARLLARQNPFGAAGLALAGQGGNAGAVLNAFANAGQRTAFQGRSFAANRRDAFASFGLGRADFAAGNNIAGNAFGLMGEQAGQAAHTNFALQDYRRRLTGANTMFNAPLRFATGGIVPGSGNQDSVPALLTPGERVLTKDQQQGLGLSQAAQQALTGFANSASQLTQGLQLFNEQAAKMQQALNSFAGNSTALADAIAKMPRSLTGQFEHRVTVIHNGAEVFATLQPQMQQMIVQNVRQELNRVFSEHLPDAGVQLT
jgi:TP901 family phage tail tape measure protein